ncbi:glutathione S-transferase [Xylariaceae sp. FL1272]|nr:glutathione S-transferase [Xylariaceae sp. FL1272]
MTITMPSYIPLRAPRLLPLLSSGPNPWKVVFLLEELNLSYEIESVAFENMKQKPNTVANPNGRVPAIHDPNTGSTLWEPGAIYRLSYDTFREQNLCNQWLMFQMSGQGPYYGQCIPSAVTRNTNEIKRVLGVLDGVLSATKGDASLLVGDKLTYADMAFVPWNAQLDAIMRVDAGKKFEGFPHVQSWHQRMAQRPSCVKAMKKRDETMPDIQLADLAEEIRQT